MGIEERLGRRILSPSQFARVTESVLGSDVDAEEVHERHNGSVGGSAIRTAPLPRKNIGGWLVLFCIATAVIGPLVNVSQALSSTSSVEQVAAIALAAYQVFVGITVIRRSPRVFGNLKVYFIVLLCLGIVNLVVGFNDIQVQDAQTVNSQGPWSIGTRNLASCFLWFFYFKRSRRVAETFGRNL